MEPKAELDARGPESQRQPRKPYQAPRLSVHGTVDALTTALLLKGSDGLAGSVPL